MKTISIYFTEYEHDEDEYVILHACFLVGLMPLEWTNHVLKNTE